jgi:L-fucose isomerase-like protein
MQNEYLDEAVDELLTYAQNAGKAAQAAAVAEGAEVLSDEELLAKGIDRAAMSASVQASLRAELRENLGKHIQGLSDAEITKRRAEMTADQGVTAS